MIDTPQITQTTAQLTAIIHLTVPRSEMRTVMGPGISEVMAAVKAQGIGPAGPWFTHHLKMDPAMFDFEICVPVTAPVTPVGRVKAGQWPAMKVARTVLHGGYEGLGGARPGQLAHRAQQSTDRLRTNTRESDHREKRGADREDNQTVDRG